MSEERLGTCDYAAHYTNEPHRKTAFCIDWRESAQASQVEFPLKLHKPGKEWVVELRWTDYRVRGEETEAVCGLFWSADREEAESFYQNAERIISCWYVDQHLPKHRYSRQWSEKMVAKEENVQSVDAGAAQPEASLTTGPRPKNKQVPEETFSEEITNGYRKQCGHIAECDCQNGVRMGAAPSRELSAEQFWATWIGATRGKPHTPKPFTVQLDRCWKFAEAYALAIRQEGERDENETLKLLLQEKAEMTAERDALTKQRDNWIREARKLEDRAVSAEAERDALKEQVDDLADTLHRANVNYAGWVEKVARAEAALREARNRALEEAAAVSEKEIVKLRGSGYQALADAAAEAILALKAEDGTND